MTVQVEIVNGGRRVVFHCSGELTGPEIADATRQLMTDDAAARRMQSGLISLEHVTALRVNAEDIHALVDIDTQLSALIPNGAVAVVAPRDHEFGMARMWEGLLNIPGWTSYVFRARSAAEAWLDQQAVSSQGR